MPAVSDTSAKTTTGTATQRQPRCAGGEVAAGTAEAATAVSNRTRPRMTKAPLVRLAAVLDPTVPAPSQGRTFSAGRAIRLADMDALGRLRLDAVARFLQDIA